jgi:hypothetical protein
MNRAPYPCGTGHMDCEINLWTSNVSGNHEVSV